MNFINKKTLIFFMVLPGIIQAELLLIDQIDCIVCGPLQNTPICDSQVTWKKSIDTLNIVPLDRQIRSEIIKQQVIYDKIPMEPDAPEKYVESIKKQQKFSDNDLKEWFAKVGQTFHEGLESLKERYMNEYFIHYKFKSQLVPTDDEIMKYYQDYPEFNPGWYEIVGARIDYDSSNKIQFEKQLKNLIAGICDDASLKIEWSSPVLIAEDDLAQDQEFIKDMKIDSIHMVDDGKSFQLYKLIAQTPTQVRSLDECRTNIIDILNQQKLEDLIQKYNDSIRSYIDVIYFDKPLSE